MQVLQCTSNQNGGEERNILKEKPRQTQMGEDSRSMANFLPFWQIGRQLQFVGYQLEFVFCQLFGRCFSIYCD